MYPWHQKEQKCWTVAQSTHGILWFLGWLEWSLVLWGHVWSCCVPLVQDRY